MQFDLTGRLHLISQRFTTVRKAYVYYSVSVKKEERIRISEFTLLPYDDNQLDHDSER